MVYVVVPTFNELDHVKRFIAKWHGILSNKELKIIIVNGNFGDVTSKLLSNENKDYILEIEATKNDFWSGLINKGLNYINEIKTSEDFIILTNIDVNPPKNLSDILLMAKKDYKIGISVPSIDQNNTLLDGGIKQISWLLDLKKKFYFQESSNNVFKKIDYCPTRFLIFNTVNVNNLLLTLEKDLPHYASDYEYTNRLRKNGYKLLCLTSSCAFNDSFNSGIKDNNIDKQDIRDILFNIKSVFNLKYRTNFILQTYPKVSIPFALLSFYLRILYKITKVFLVQKFTRS